MGCIAYQALQSMEFSRQEYWSGLPFPSPGHLPNPGIEPWSPALQADALPPEPLEKPNYHLTYSQIGRWPSLGIHCTLATVLHSFNLLTTTL